MPPANPDWGLEISLDLDMVSAVCPNCHILLVEGTTNLDSDLYTAEDTAAALGANAISNSWGGDEYSGETADDVHFNHSGAAITVSSGDNGYGVEYPAASRYVTAVGGTSLNRGGGTSASSPIIASVYALAGNGSSVSYGSYPYSHASSLFDVVGGSNGTCSPGYLCTGVAGYDGPTGLGSRTAPAASRESRPKRARRRRRALFAAAGP
jgi:subtilase family serine protease